MKDKIITILRQAGGRVSGEDLSRALGVSRTAVWKYIESLREAGYVIEGQSRTGYLLVRAPDLLLPSEVQDGLRTLFVGRNIIYISSTASTNDLAREVAQEKPEGTVVISEEQTGGKGRRGRGWISPYGKGLWFSVILRPQITPAEAPKLTLVAAVAVARAIREFTALNVGIKWPNDILLNGRKVCGILTEMEGEMDAIRHVIIGIGVNVNQAETEFPLEVRSIATSLKEALGHPVSRKELLQSILLHLEDEYKEFISLRGSGYLAKWKQLSVTLGRRVRVLSFDRVLVGLAEDIDEYGALLVRTPEGRLERVLAGDVSLRDEG